jgi:hypothetical protein
VRWQKAIGKRLKKLRLDRPELFADGGDEIVRAGQRTVDAVHALSGGDNWIRAWSLLLLASDLRKAPDVDAAMAAVTVRPDVLLDRARNEWPAAEVQRLLRTLDRWDVKRYGAANVARQDWIWANRRITIPRVPLTGNEQRRENGVWYGAEGKREPK